MPEERSRIKWDHLNSERLVRIYNFVGDAKTSKEFFDVVSSMFGEGLSSTAIRRQCQKMGLTPKVSSEVSKCLEPDCSKVSEVRGRCMKHYKSRYFQEVYKHL